MKKPDKNVLFSVIGLLFFLWLVLTTLVYSFVNPEKTQTEVFLHIPKSIMLDFRATSNIELGEITYKEEI